MSILSIAFPAEAILPSLEAFALGALDMLPSLLIVISVTVVGMAFKPLLTGLVRAGLLALRPRRVARD